MGDINPVRNFESVCSTELSPFISDGFVFLVTILLIYIVHNWRRGVESTLGSTIICSKHLYLPEMRNLYFNSLVVLWKRLFPWLPIDSHVRFLSCTFAKLESDSMCLNMIKQRKCSCIRASAYGGNQHIDYKKTCVKPVQDVSHVHLERAERAHAKRF